MSLISWFPALIQINRRTATIRYMFHNKDDIEYFKPVKLRTRCGRLGHIKESLGMCLYVASLYSYAALVWSYGWKPTATFFKTSNNGAKNQFFVVYQSLYMFWSINSLNTMRLNSSQICQDFNPGIHIKFDFVF